MFENGLASYLSEFDVPFIDDWPAQFYVRQIVYSPSLDWPVVQNNVPFIGHRTLLCFSSVLGNVLFEVS